MLMYLLELVVRLEMMYANKLKFIYKSLFVFVSLIFSSYSFASTNNIVYVNGIQNTLDMAIQSSTKILNVLSNSGNHNTNKINFKVSYVWNPIGWSGTSNGSDLSQDKKELFLLKTAEEKFSSDFQKIVSPYNQSTIVDKKIAKRVAAYLSDLTPGANTLEKGKNPVTDKNMAVTKTAINKLVTAVKNYGSVVVVAHSQGNLLANLAYAQLASEFGTDVNKKIRIVNVANTSQFAVSGFNFTHAGDRALFPSYLNNDLTTLPSQGINWNRTTPICSNSACNFIIAPATFGAVDTGGAWDPVDSNLQHGFTSTYLSDFDLPTILDTQGVNFTAGATRFVDRFEDFVYTAANSIFQGKYTVSPVSTTISKDTVFTVTGVNLTNGMEFSIQDCSPSSNELSGGTSTKRQFRCTMNGIAGEKIGVLKDKLNGNKLYNFSIKAQVGTGSKWLSTITPPDYIVKNIINIDFDNLPNGAFSGSGQYLINKDSIGCHLTQDLAVKGTRNGSTIDIQTTYISSQTTCTDGTHTASPNFKSNYSGSLNTGVLLLNPHTGTCDFLHNNRCYNFTSFSPTP